ncbi:MAG: inosine-5-monophosphate dehydrogenase [Candidatus Aenigmatarchaeota archaeon]|nr:MAG: inosine-5-monophosphate dehydrogenase [Candidatus Aenigmarchaeota archaeon]
MIVTGHYMKHLREEQGYSQQELAKLAGISQAHVAKIELEKVDPRLSTVNSMLTVLLKGRKKPTCRTIMKRGIISAKPEDKVLDVITSMKKLGISQVPIFSNGQNIGSIREMTIIRNAHKRLKLLQVQDIIDEPFPVVNSSDSTEVLPGLLDYHAAVLVADKGRIMGIITKSDLIKI